MLSFQIADFWSVVIKTDTQRGAECPSLCSWLSPKWLCSGGTDFWCVCVCVCVCVCTALLFFLSSLSLSFFNISAVFLSSCHKVFLWLRYVGLWERVRGGGPWERKRAAFGWSFINVSRIMILPAVPLLMRIITLAQSDWSIKPRENGLL